VRFFTAFSAILLGACQLIGGYEDFDYGTPPKAALHACSVLPTAKEDELGLSVMARVDLQDDACIWMDRTEVTVEQYERWRGDVPADGIAWEPDWCGWKRVRTDPIGDPDDACAAEILGFDRPPFAPRKPMRCVDFCEAEAFCRWADKHLCYDADGLGAQGPRGNPQEWRLACTNQMTTRYPWGTEELDVCNTGQTSNACIGASATCGPVLVGQKVDCKTPGGIVDLLGNVSEWVFSCNYVVSPEPTGCLTRGGGYDDPLLACEAETTLRNSVRKPSLGFRCCANLTPGEEEEIALRSTRR
jgi:formylglycine-generating enzyme required for sulfatase activity